MKRIIFIHLKLLLRTIYSQINERATVVFQPYNTICQRKLRIFADRYQGQETGISQVNPLTRRPSNSDSRAFDT